MNRTFSKRTKSGISKSNAVTAIILVSFVAIVVVALVFTYLVPPASSPTTSTTSGLYFSQISMISGTDSTNSFNASCSGDAYLELAVSNLTSNPISITNVTIFATRMQTNATALIPLSNGCIPVSEARPEISSGANQYLVVTYPNVPIPPFTQWNVTFVFSNGQTLTQNDLVSNPNA